MIAIQRIHTIPENSPVFFDEMAQGIRTIYGNRAATAYRNTIDIQIEHAIHHPQVLTYSAENDGKTVGICGGIIQDGKCTIVLLHVLAEFERRGVEAPLLEKLIKECHQMNLGGIIYENIPLFDADVNTTFAAQGFSHLPRVLMNGPLTETKGKPYESVPIQAFQFEIAASILIDSYSGHPDRILHQEIRSVPAAVKLMTNVNAGLFGACDAEYIRWIFDGQEPAGIILGCESVEGVGFILQVAVKKTFQGKGLGKVMIEEMKDIFSGKGLDMISLGVTQGNPAQDLYKKCGMEPVKHLDSFAWWSHPIDI
jgi:ribosomal protein S18 acetylase RimI-like enzyme/N-acetylglutamate synthase-like GNAT family acetyltransferase